MHREIFQALMIMDYENPKFKSRIHCYNPKMGQIWTNPNVGLKMSFKI